MEETMNNYEHIQKTPQNESEWLHALVSLARFLRSPDGCPWDRKQTTESFAQYIQEEAGELLEALREKDGNAHAEEEWGDTLFTIFATLAAAESEGRFSLENAARRAHEKMIRRHGHIFGDYTAESPEEVLEVWRKIKEQEKLEKKQQNGVGQE
jgi:tetrapyrrole methylase family protein/MazG family protein